MDPKPKRPGSITFLLVGLVLLVTGAGMFAAFVPIVKCPVCLGLSIGVVLKNGSQVPIKDVTEGAGNYVFYKTSSGERRRIDRNDIQEEMACERCSGRKRVSILNLCFR
jgi:hypothetical protein